MAQKVLVQLVDDLNGTSSEDISTVLFGLDGVNYEIDLSDANAKRLRDALAEYIASARRTGGRIKRGIKASSGQPSTNGEAGQIRDWANENGYELSARGRIPSHVVEAFKDAQAEQKTAKPATKRRPRATKS